MSKIPKGAQLAPESKMFSIDIFYGKSVIMMVTTRATTKEEAQLSVMKKLKFTTKEIKNGD